MESLRQALQTAVSDGDLDQIRRLIDPAVPHTELVRRELLSYALGVSCKDCQVECVKTMLDLKARPDTKCENLQFLPLFYAAQLANETAQQASRIIKLLADSGADLDVRDQDHNGSNALMWAKTKEAAESLLSEAAQKDKSNERSYIDSRDNDGKTALIWSIITRTDISVPVFLIEKGSDLSGTDDQGSTPLHWAARENNWLFARYLLESFGDIKVNVINHGGRTPLHLAVGKGCGQMVKGLLEFDARDVEKGAQSTLDVESAGGWLPLHVACGAPRLDPSTAWQLISRSQPAHLIRPTSTGKTPLIIAADKGNAAMVEQLLIRIRSVQEELNPKSDLYAKLLSARGMRDNAGNIALFNTGICESSIAREFLAPWSLEDVNPKPNANDPTKCFQAKIVDLLTQPKKIDVGRTSVFDLIYTNPEHSHGAARRTLPRKPCKYRWIHLPANKRSWCRDLFAKYFIELWQAGRIEESADSYFDQLEGDKVELCYPRDGRDVEQVNAMQDSQKPASDTDSETPKGGFNKTYTVEHFQMLARTLIMQRIGTTTHSAYMRPRCRAILPAHINSLGIRRHSEGSHLEDDPKDDDEDSASEDSSTKINSHSKSATDHDSRVHPAERLSITSPRLFMYMPYLHYEFFGDLCKMKEALSLDPTEDATGKSRSKTPRKGPYSKLLFTGLHGEDRDYHPRRTLDQFLYRSIATDERDKDQVAYRYQSDDGPNGLKIRSEQCKVIMVDELWMWIVSEEFIVTSFPERWNQVTKTRFDIWESVINEITARGPDLASTVYDLAALISDTCSKAFDFCVTAQPRFIDMFEASLGGAMEGAMNASRRLNQASAQGSKWLRTVSEEMDTEEQSGGPQNGGVRSVSTASKNGRISPLTATATKNKDEDGMAFVDSLLDLRDETDLVYQMSDTRDEMEILSTVLTWQRRILQDLSSVLAATSLADSGDSNWGCKRAVHFIKSSLRTVNSTTSELKRMDKQAKRIYATVTNILDIKQKYANAIEARSVRAGGLTIMVFTVATVFFLPASFIISFFGLNLSSLRHEHGNISLSPGFVCRWVLGLGLGVALLYLAVAFQFRNILRWLGINKIRRWWTKTYDASKSADAKYRNVSKAAGSSSRVSRISTGMSFNSRQRRRPSSVDGRGEV